MGLVYLIYERSTLGFSTRPFMYLLTVSDT